MYCPKCRAEFREGFGVCSDCGVALVEELPPEPTPEYADLVTVLSAADETVVTMAESILIDADIRFLAKGEGVQDLFGLGRIGAGFNPMLGPVEIQVLPEDADEAAALLEQLKDYCPGVPEEDIETVNEGESEE
ncbi:MAG TPA: hypothetical protein ENN42_08030 [Thioalkalivibrio sp.]|nr:hypothetical protein [Thioalkalivibrio sp.]